MDQSKWEPTEDERELKTDRYRYVIGMYDHPEIGDGNFRVSQYKLDGTYVGQFFLIHEVLPAIVKEHTLDPL